jgi:hypothetical protein
MRTLLTITQIKKYKTISDFAPSEKVNTFVNEAQFIELRNVLGQGLFDKVVENISPLNYPELDIQIEPMLAYYSYARYLSQNQVNATAFGVVQKRNEFSEPTSEKTLMRIVGQAREMGKAYERELIKFLNNNKENYPEWESTCERKEPNSGSIKMSAVGNKESVNDFVKNQINIGNNVIYKR